MKSVSDKQADHLQEILPMHMLWMRPYLYLPQLTLWWNRDITWTVLAGSRSWRYGISVI